jgi:hypothetical protein
VTDTDGSPTPITNAFNEIISRLRAIEDVLRNGRDKPPDKIPLIDPTANVLSLVSAAITRQDDLRKAEFRRLDDLRNQEQGYIAKLEEERQRANSESKKAEAGRIDALLAANTNNVALALEKQGAQATAQDRRISVLEQNQYQGVGREGQRTEGRQQSQWVIGLIIGAIIAIIQLSLHLIGK